MGIWGVISWFARNNDHINGVGLMADRAKGMTTISFTVPSGMSASQVERELNRQGIKARHCKDAGDDEWFLSVDNGTRALDAINRM